MFSRQTYFTTNLTLDGLRERYGDFIVDRLIEMCEWVHMDGSRSESEDFARAVQSALTLLLRCPETEFHF